MSYFVWAKGADLNEVKSPRIRQALISKLEDGSEQRDKETPPAPRVRRSWHRKHSTGVLSHEIDGYKGDSEDLDSLLSFIEGAQRSGKRAGRRRSGGARKKVCLQDCGGHQQGKVTEGQKVENEQETLSIMTLVERLNYISSQLTKEDWDEYEEMCRSLVEEEEGNFEDDVQYLRACEELELEALNDSLIEEEWMRQYYEDLGYFEEGHDFEDFDEEENFEQVHDEENYEEVDESLSELIEKVRDLEIFEKVNDSKNLEKVNDSKNFEKVNHSKNFEKVHDSKVFEKVNDSKNFEKVNDSKNFEEVRDSEKFEKFRDLAIFEEVRDSENIKREEKIDEEPFKVVLKKGKARQERVETETATVATRTDWRELTYPEYVQDTWPASWLHSNNPSQDELQPEQFISDRDQVIFQELYPKSSTYEEIIARFYNLTSRYLQIETIHNIKNNTIWLKYNSKREEMKKAHPTEFRENFLFHGTKSRNIPSIARFNFDPRLSGQNCGHRFGQGVCFTPMASYASHYTDQLSGSGNTMILARVLIARACQGHYDFRVPPSGYDTTLSPSGRVVVKYEEHTFYPEYLITFAGTYHRLERWFPQ